MRERYSKKLKGALELKANSRNIKIVILILMNHLLRDVENLMKKKRFIVKINSH